MNFVDGLKKRWVRPRLIVLVSEHKQEKVLVICKTARVAADNGPVTGWYDCTQEGSCIPCMNVNTS